MWRARPGVEPATATGSGRSEPAAAVPAIAPDLSAGSLTERVRRSCAWACERAQSVSISGDAAAYAQALLPLPEPGWDESTHYLGGEAETAAYVLTLDAVNFGSGYFPSLVKREGRSGYFTIALALKERFERQGPLTARELRAMTPQAAAELFGQPPGDGVREELMRHFARALADLGAFLEERFGGSFEALVASAGRSAERLAEELAQMPYFRDVASYRGGAVAFYKRAQIAPSDLSLALGGEGLGRFDDLKRLTIFADNLVPHVLRLDGLVTYEPALAARLERGEPLPAGSAAEVEIRACAVQAVELMTAALAARGLRVTARQLDLALWNRGQAPRYRGGAKHRTRTVFY